MSPCCGITSVEGGSGGNDIMILNNAIFASLSPSATNSNRDQAELAGNVYQSLLHHSEKENHVTLFIEANPNHTKLCVS